MSYQEIPHFCHKEIDWNWYHNCWYNPFSANLQIQKTAEGQVVESQALDPFSNIPGCRCISSAYWVYVRFVTLITLSQAELIHETIWNQYETCIKYQTDMTRLDYDDTFILAHQSTCKWLSLVTTAALLGFGRSVVLQRWRCLVLAGGLAQKLLMFNLNQLMIS